MNEHNTEPQPYEGPAGETVTAPSTGVPMPVSQRVFIKALRWSIVATALLAVVFSVIGYTVSGMPGLYGGLIGSAGAGVFLGLTVASMAFANRFHRSDMYLPLFFGIVMGSWVLKLILFIVVALLLRTQPWLDPQILFIAVICGAIISVVIDSLIVIRTRIPTVDGTD